MNMKTAHPIVGVLFACAVAAADEPVASPPADERAVEAAAEKLSARDMEIIRHVLGEGDSPRDRDGRLRIYFLTTTPKDEWGGGGDWKPLPEPFMKSIVSLKTKYRPANEAYLKQGHVLDKKTDKPAWMRWITIKRWISDSEVELEDGVWCCPLGGGASTLIYKKVDGKWQIKSVLESRIS